MKDYIKRLNFIDRGTLVRVLAQTIHELTIDARAYYDQPDALNHVVRVNEAIHRLSGHLRNLTDNSEVCSLSRAEGVAENLQLLTPSALERVFGSAS